MMHVVVVADIDDCVDDPCLNDGECVDGINAYTCDCPDGFTGVNCADGIVISYPQYSVFILTVS